MSANLVELLEKSKSQYYFLTNPSTDITYLERSKDFRRSSYKCKKIEKDAQNLDIPNLYPSLIQLTEKAKSLTARHSQLTLAKSTIHASRIFAFHGLSLKEIEKQFQQIASSLPEYLITFPIGYLENEKEEDGDDSIADKDISPDTSKDLWNTDGGPALGAYVENKIQHLYNSSVSATSKACASSENASINKLVIEESWTATKHLLEYLQTNHSSYFKLSHQPKDEHDIEAKFVAQNYIACPDHHYGRAVSLYFSARVKEDLPDNIITAFRQRTIPTHLTTSNTGFIRETDYYHLDACFQATKKLICGPRIVTQEAKPQFKDKAIPRWIASCVAALEDQFAEKIVFPVTNCNSSQVYQEPDFILENVEKFAFYMAENNMIPEESWMVNPRPDNAQDESQQSEINNKALMHNQVPLWPQLFLALRMGSLSVVYRLAQAYEQLFTEIAPAFYSYLTFLIDKNIKLGSGEEFLPTELNYVSAVCNEYERNIENDKEAGDPYQRICYVLLARLSPTESRMTLTERDANILCESIEDFLWYRLINIRSAYQKSIQIKTQNGDSTTLSLLPLSQVVEEVRELGSSYFDPENNKPYLFAYILLMTGQFEEIISYLSANVTKNIDRLPDVVHLALLLSVFGYLPSETCGASSKFASTFPELIRKYTLSFARSYPLDAIMYCYTLPASDEKNEILKEVLSQLSEPDVILGTYSPTGVYNAGVLEQYMELTGDFSFKEVLSSVMREIGMKLESTKHYELALRMSDPTCDPDRTFNLLLKILIREMKMNVVTSSFYSLFERATQYHYAVASKKIPQPKDQYTWACFLNVLHMAQVMILKDKGNLEDALDLLERSTVIPWKSEHIVRKAQDFNNMIRFTNIDDVSHGFCKYLEAIIDILLKIFSQAQNELDSNRSIFSNTMEGGKRQRSKETQYKVKEFSKLFLSFTSLIKYTTKELSSQLTKLEFVTD